MEPARKRLILRRGPGALLAALDLFHRLDDRRDIAVLETSEDMVLVEGEAAALDALADNLTSDGWVAYPVRSIERPDVRPRVLKPPRSQHDCD